MLNIQLPGLLQHLKMMQVMDSVTFSPELEENTKKVEKEVRRLLNLSKSTKEYKEYDKKRIKLAESMAVKDGKDFVTEMIDGAEHFTFEDRKAFDKALKELRKEYKVEIAERKKQLKNQKKELDKESNLELKNFEVYV